MATFRLTRPALDDLLEIADHLAGDDLVLAERILEDLESAMRLLAERPGMGHARGDLHDDPDLRFWPVHRYLIVYRSRSGPLEIVRIVHASRDVGRELDS